MIRVESAKTQEYVSAFPLAICMKQKNGGGEEMDELSFVPSAVSDPRWALHMWNNKCREKGFQFFQIAAIVSKERDAAHTLNLCWTCHTERRLKQGEEDVAACRALVERKVFSREVTGTFWYGTILAQDVGTFHHQKKAWTRSVLAGADTARQNGTDGRWQHETAYEEELELLRHCTDLRLEEC